MKIKNLMKLLAEAKAGGLTLPEMAEVFNKINERNK
jgi:hypothetical protein